MPDADAAVAASAGARASSASAMKVAVVGLGRMGRPIARRLLRAGHDVAVYNRTVERVRELVDAGAHAATDIASACNGRDVVMTMVADDAALEAVVLGPGGLRDSLASGAIHVAMGTHGVAAVDRMEAAHREASQRFLAAPVLGRPEAAEAGELGIVVAGDAGAASECAPLFEAIGRRDYTMIMATTLMFAVLTMLSNLLTDVAYGILDPRIRLE